MGWKPPSQLGEDEDSGDAVANNRNTNNISNDDSCGFFNHDIADGFDPFNVGEGMTATTKGQKNVNANDDDNNNDWVSFPSTTSGSSSEDDNETEDDGFSSYKKRNNIRLSTRNLRGRQSSFTPNMTTATPKRAVSLIPSRKSPPMEAPKRLQSLPNGRNSIGVGCDRLSSSIPKRIPSLDSTASTSSRRSRSRSRRRRGCTDASSGDCSHRRRVSIGAGSGSGQRRKGSTDMVSGGGNSSNRRQQRRGTSSSRGKYSQIKANNQIVQKTKADSSTTATEPSSHRNVMTATTKDDISSSESESNNNISSSIKVKQKNRQNVTSNHNKEEADDLMSWLENMALKNNANSNNSAYSNSDNLSIGGNSIQSAPAVTTTPKIHRSGRRITTTTNATKFRHSSAATAGSSLASSATTTPAVTAATSYTTTPKCRRRKNKFGGETAVASTSTAIINNNNKSLSNNLPFRSPTSAVSSTETLSLDVAELVEKGLIHVGADGKLKLVIDLPGAIGAE